MNIQLQDFPPNSLIYRVAKRDIHLACEILKTYGGKKNYLPKQESIQRCARDREITELRIRLILPGELAREFGLSRNRILKIIRKGLNLRFPCGKTWKWASFARATPKIEFFTLKWPILSYSPISARDRSYRRKICDQLYLNYMGIFFVCYGHPDKPEITNKHLCGALWNCTI